MATRRRANPFWHSSNSGPSNLTFDSKPVNNPLGIYLEIRQLGQTYEVYTWENKFIGRFSSAKEAEVCARNYKTPLMPTSSIKDIRFVPDPKTAPPKPKKHEKAVMTPVAPSTGKEFIPIQEEDEIVVPHPDDVIVF